MSDSVQPHRRQPIRLPHPWDSPGKNTGVGFHFLLQCMKVKSESEVAQSCLTLCDLMDCSPPASSPHWIFQAKVLEWGAIAFSVLTALVRYNLHTAQVTHCKCTMQRFLVNWLIQPSPQSSFRTFPSLLPPQDVSSWSFVDNPYSGFQPLATTNFLFT